MWIPLGQISKLSWDWDLFPVPDVGSDRFRITQVNGRNLHNGYGVIGSFYSDGEFSGRFGWQRIYADWDGAREKTLFTQPFPDELISAGIITRYLGCRLGRGSVLAGPWTLILEAEIRQESVAWQPGWNFTASSLINSGDFTEFKGFASSETLNTGTVGILPEGFRPIQSISYQNVDGSRESNITITPLGEIMVVSGSQPFRLDIVFRNKL